MDMRTLTAVQTEASKSGRDLVVLHSLLFNLPGFHGSEPAIAALMDAYVARIEDGFQEWRIGSDAILLGNGFGGTVALAFALAHPERITKLVVSDAAAGFPEEGRKAFAAMADGSPPRVWRRWRKSRPSASTRRPISSPIQARSTSASRC